MSKSNPDEKQSDITSLQENFSKQQKKISALKELVRKSEVAHGKSTSSTQEKVKNIAQRLTHLKSKARSRHSIDLSQEGATIPEGDTNRHTSGIGDVSFSLSQSPLSASQFSTPNPTPQKLEYQRSDSVSSTASLPATIQSSEKVLLLRRQMEENRAKMAERENSKREIEQLVTQLKAKFDTTQQCLEHSSELGRSMNDLSSLVYAPSTRDRHRSATDLSTAPFNLDKERIKFLDNRVRLLEKQLEKERQMLGRDISGIGDCETGEHSDVKRVKELENKILELEESIKEKNRTEELMANINSHEIEESWQIENDRLKTELLEKTRRIASLEEVNDILETTKCDLTMKTTDLEEKLQKYEEKCKELEKTIDSTGQQPTSSGENQKFEIIYQEDVEEKTSSQTQQLQDNNIKALEFENAELKEKLTELQKTKEQMSEDEVEKKIISLEQIIESQREDCQKHLERMKEIDEDLMEKTIELNVLTANFAVLEEKLKESNRTKPLFAAVGTDAGDYLRAQEEIAELKRKLQESNKAATSNEKTETVCVASQMEAIQLEEEVTLLKTTIKNLENELKANLKEIERYNQNFIELQEEKDATDKKLEHYIAENMELLDKIEKLSKSSSSAESIEIVERLTQQERAEIDAFNKQLEKEHEEDEEVMRQTQVLVEAGGCHDHTADAATLTCSSDMGEELSDSLIKLREESSELMNKIELFTSERKEVLEKMEFLTIENQEHIRKIENLLEEKGNLEASSLVVGNERDNLQKKFDNAVLEKNQLSAQIAQISSEKHAIAQELNALSKATALAVPNDSVSLLEKCQKSLDRLNVELESYRKTNDKNIKFSISKKLCKEAKNAHQQLSELLKQIKETGTTHDEMSSAINTENENLNVRCTTLQSTVEDLRRELAEARLASEEKSTEIDRLNREIFDLKTMSDDFDQLMNDKEMANEKQMEQLTRLRREFEGKCETYENEMEILQTLIIEQKQQLIDSYKENEFENNKRLTELQKRDEIIKQLNEEIKNIQESNSLINEQYLTDLKAECEALREAQTISKTLLAEQIDDLTNKQETIDTLNAQIMELYKTMEDNANKVIEKEDEVVSLQEIIASNKVLIDRFNKETYENKSVVDKLLAELHSQKLNLDQLNKLPHLEGENRRLRASIEDLEHRNKELLEKLKKYAANLKKRTLQCQEQEQQIKSMEISANQKTQDKENFENLNQSKENMQLMEMRLKTAEEALAESNAKIQSLQVRHLEAQNDNRLEEELHNARLEINDKNEKLQYAQNELDAYKRNQEQLELSNIMKNSEIEKLKSEIHAKTMSLQQAENALIEVQDELQALQEEERESRAQSEDMSKEIANISEQKLLSDCLQRELMMAKEQLHQKDVQIQEFNEELRSKSMKFEKCKAIVKEKNREVQRLTRELADLNQRVSQLPEEEEEDEEQTQVSAAAASLTSSSDIHANCVSRTDYETIKEANAKLIQEHSIEKQNFEETISRLETLHDGIQAKLLVDMNYIESIEQENTMFKDKICKLEECVASFEERRASMERRANLLDEKMQTQSDEYEKTEDVLVYRLNMLSNHDEIIAQRLLESQSEKEELAEKLETLKMDYATISAKHTKLEKEFGIYREETRSTVEAENDSLREQLAIVGSESNRLRTSYEAKLIAKHTEIDELETELSEQLRKIGLEKRTLMEDLERARDQLDEQRDELCRLKETVNSLEQAKSDLEREMSWIKMQNDNFSQDQLELQELRMQTIQDKTELENLHHQIDVLAQNHEVELNALRTQISELDTVRMQVGQNQTDDQVFIETENKRLTDLLAEKEALLENYQRQNLQLQMGSAAGGIPFATIPQTAQTSVDNDNSIVRERCNRLERELGEKSEQTVRAIRDLAALQAEFHGLVESNGEMQRHLAEKQREIDHLRSIARPSAEPVPPQSLFFASEQMSPSPFDEIVNVRHNVDHRLEQGAVNPSAITAHSLPIEQPTIEDLQRNVSDLEKHANDLENKLAMRIVMHEDAQRQLEELKRTSEVKLRELQKKQESYEERLREMEMQAMEKSLEKQIISSEPPPPPPPLTQDKTDTSAPSLDMFFRGPLPPTAAHFENIIIPPSEIVPSQPEPVVEEQIIPKKSYICYPSTDKSQMDSNLDFSDGWGEGWGVSETNEPIIDTQNYSFNLATSLIPKEQQLEMKLQESNEKIQQLEIERDRLHQQKQEMQVKSGKLMKRLKEYKMKNDELSTQAAGFRKSSSIESNSNELDLAIQDELKSQILQLENKLAEAVKVAAEKENFLKRIDILTAANEKLTEMKERQDYDVQMYQTRIRELNQSLQRLQNEVGVEKLPENNSIPPPTISVSDQLIVEKTHAELEEQIVALKSEIEDIAGDKAELQAMLDEEKANSERAENIVRTLREKIVVLENAATSDKAIEQSTLNEMRQQRQSLEEQCQKLEVNRNQLKAKLEEKTSSLEKYKNQLETISNQNQDLLVQIQNLQQNLNESREELKELASKQSEYILQRNQEIDSAQKHSIEIERLASELENCAAQNRDLISKNLELQSMLQNSTDSTEMEQKIKEISEATDRIGQLENRITELSSQNVNLETKIAELSAENANLKIKLENVSKSSSTEFDLLSQNSSLHRELENLRSNRNSNDELEMQLQEKDSEIMHLKQRIEDLMREDQTEKLVLEILTKNQEIHMLKMQVKNLQDDKQELENNLSIQLTREMEQRCAELEQSLRDSQMEKANMEEELKVLNNHVLSSLELEDKLKEAALVLDAKNIEIAELRGSLETVKQAANTNSELTNVAIEEKCSEIAQMWREHLYAREDEYKANEGKLVEEINNLKSSRAVVTGETPTPTSSSTATSSATESKGASPVYQHDAEAALHKMQSVLESQEIEIVTLKEQLAIRSAEYARLAAQYDPFKMQTTLSHSGGAANVIETTTTTPRRAANVDGNLVAKSELDLALYMLHQRDMRCEELTLELVNLLDERDTLQLKLSNTLRQVEEIKTQTNYADGGATTVNDSIAGEQENPDQQQQQQQISSSSVTNLNTSIVGGSDDELNLKLSQLQTVNHSKDKRLQEERQQRSRQMEQIQQDVAKMPPQAVSELVGSDMGSLSHLSPSSVILNWLWGGTNTEN